MAKTAIVHVLGYFEGCDLHDDLMLQDKSAALDERLERGEARRAEQLASRQRPGGKVVDGALEEAQRRRRCAWPFRRCACSTAQYSGCTHLSVQGISIGISLLH